MSDGYYNIVLIPDDETARVAVSFAFETFSGIANGYCLEEGKVFPHITLGQFQTDHFETAQRIFEHVKRLKGTIVIPQVTFSDMYAKHDIYDGIKCLWIGFAVLQSDELAMAQEKVDGLLQSEGLSLLNASLGDYWPHMTLARICEETPIPLFSAPDRFKQEMINGWNLAVGHSDKNGQFLGSL